MELHTADCERPLDWQYIAKHQDSRYLHWNISKLCMQVEYTTPLLKLFQEKK